MNERDALRALAADLPHAGDDAAVVGDTVITTDMLHERTDFPPGTTRYTAGWRAVGASLSDIAAMGADPTAAVAVYADESFESAALERFVAGAVDVCEAVDAEYVGGDLDTHAEFTTASTAIGDVTEHGPVTRSGAAPGDALCVTGEWGRSAAALRLFERGAGGKSEEGDERGKGGERGGRGGTGGEAPIDTDPAPTADESIERANDLFRFTPRVADGLALAGDATAMMDSSDGLARSLHQLAEAAEVGFALDTDALPVHPAVDDVADDSAERFALAAHFGEDFELVCTIPEPALDRVRERCPSGLVCVGSVVDADGGVTADGEPLPDRGYTHG